MIDDNRNDDDFEDLDFEELDDEDFADDDDLLGDDLAGIEAEDIAGDDDEWNDDLDDDVAAPLAKKGKKSASGMAIPAILILAALGGGGYFYMTTMQDAQAPTIPYEQDMDAGDISANFDNSITEPTIPMPAPISSPEEEFAPDYADAIGGIENNSDDIPSEQYPITDITPVEDELTDPSQSDTSALTPMPGDTDVEIAGILPTDIIDIEAIEPDEIPVEIEPQIEQIDMASPDASAATSPAEDMGAEDMSTLDIASVENTEQPEVPLLAEIPAMDTAQNDNSQQLENEISSLEQTVQSQEGTISSLNERIAELQNQLASRDQALSDAQKKFESQQKSLAQVAEKAPVKTQSADVSPIKKKAAAIKEPIQPKWELRSAQPGRAYVAIKGAKDMQVVEIGNTLQGIGKITSISQNDGLWIVQGTQGKISQ